MALIVLRINVWLGVLILVGIIGFYDSNVEVSDTDPDHFLLGDIRLARSFDGGITYTDMMAQNNGIGYRHVDIQEIEINGNDAWVASDGGIDYYNAVTLDIIESRNKGIDGSHFGDLIKVGIMI